MWLSYDSSLVSCDLPTGIIILVALNPYCDMPIYESEVIMAYRRDELGEMEPHVYGIAEDAIRSMDRSGSLESKGWGVELEMGWGRELNVR